MNRHASGRSIRSCDMTLSSRTRRTSRPFIALVFLFASLSTVRTSAKITDLGATFSISGSAADISDTTSTSGLTFDVGLRNISYAGQVESTFLEQKADGGMTIWLALRDVKLTIQRTDISAQRRGAHCGPMQIVLGHRRPLWIAFDVVAEPERNRTPLKLGRVLFGLPQDNWHVGSPAWVKTWGLGMSEAVVLSGLKSGLSGKRKEIEAHIFKVGPTIFSQLTQFLEQRQTTQGLAND